jgi:hypothetical protein
MVRFAALLALGFFFVAPAARAQGMVTTCVEVATSRSDAQELERLVKSEVARHPTHVVVERDCRTTIEVEIIEIAEGRFLNGRIGSQVPYRVRVEGPNGLVPALEELLRVVLHNDPVLLEGPKQQSFLAGSVDQLRRKGRNLYGLEAFEWIAPVGGRLEQLPGAALRVRREVSPFYVGVRIGAAFRLGGAQRFELRPMADVAADAEIGLFASPLSDISLYASALVGIEHQRYAGPAPLLGEGATGDALQTGLSFGLRGGVELLRTTDARFDLFVQISAPAFVARDIDGGVIHAWVPSAMVGGGVAF